MHLHVGDLEQATAFCSEALGFDRITWNYPGALFLGAGYHHHLGTNVWAGPSAIPPSIDEARLIEWTIELPDGASLADAADSVSLSGHPLNKSDAGDFSTRDPWGTTVRLRVSDDPRGERPRRAATAPSSLHGVGRMNGRWPPLRPRRFTVCGHQRALSLGDGTERFRLVSRNVRG